MSMMLFGVDKFSRIRYSLAYAMRDMELTTSIAHLLGVDATSTRQDADSFSRSIATALQIANAKAYSKRYDEEVDMSEFGKFRAGNPYGGYTDLYKSLLAVWSNTYGEDVQIVSEMPGQQVNHPLPGTAKFLDVMLNILAKHLVESSREYSESDAWSN